MELEQHEKDLFLGYLEKRLGEYSSEEALDKTYQEKTKLLIQKLNGRLPHFTPLEKSFLIGCLQQYFLDGNEDLYLISDFDLLFRDTLLERRIEQMDTHLILRNKLIKKSEKPKNALF